MNPSSKSRPPFVFDGCGINGPDKYASRLATLTGAGHALNIGPKLAAALNGETDNPRGLSILLAQLNLSKLTPKQAARLIEEASAVASTPSNGGNAFSASGPYIKDSNGQILFQASPALYARPDCYEVAQSVADALNAQPSNGNESGLRDLLKRCADALDLAFEAEGDVFRKHHNSVVDTLGEARAALAGSPVVPSLLDAIAAVEAVHFRTTHDTGANDCALTVWNTLRKEAGLPSVSCDDLSAWDGKAYVRPEGSKLL